jgi:DNA polymerase-3 subunit delta'
MAEDEGLAISAIVDNLLANIPDFRMSKGYGIADALVKSDTGFSTFMDLLRAGVSSAVRAAARGHADPEQERMMAAHPIEAWGDLWFGLTRLQDETERFSLDKRQAIVAGLGMLTGTAP